jgi:hypothetical protein
MMKSQFSIKILFWVVVVVAFVIHLAGSEFRLRKAKKEIEALQVELGSVRPIAFSDVSKQLKSKLGRIVKVNIGFIKYNPNQDTYFVLVEWEDQQKNETTGQTVRFRRSGGSYLGLIYVLPFAKVEPRENEVDAVEPFQVLLETQ